MKVIFFYVLFKITLDDISSNIDVFELLNETIL